MYLIVVAWETYCVIKFWVKDFAIGNYGEIMAKGIVKYFQLIECCYSWIN